MRCAESRTSDRTRNRTNRISITAAIHRSNDRFLSALREQPIVKCRLQRMHDVSRRLQCIGRVATRERSEYRHELIRRVRTDVVERVL